MVEFRRAGVFKAEDLAALRVDAGKYVADDAILSGGVHGLQDEEHGVAVIRIVHALQPIELFGVLVQRFAVVRLRSVKRVVEGGSFSERNLFPLVHAEQSGIDVHQTSVARLKANPLGRFPGTQSIDRADALAACAKRMHVQPGITGPMADRAVGILGNAALKHQGAAAVANRTSLVTSLTGSETGSALDDKCRSASDHRLL